MTRSDSAPLLIDTSSLLRAGGLKHVIKGGYEIDGYGEHAFAVLDSLILYEHILLDGPSLARNSDDLDWLPEIGDGIEVLELDQIQVAELYGEAEGMASRIRPDPAHVDFMRMHMPRELGGEIDPTGFAPSTYWSDLERELPTEDLRRLQQVFAVAFGGHVPFSGAAFVAMARLFYYLCLQESVGSSLLLDPLKGYDVEPGAFESAESILDLFDAEVGDAFRDRKGKWLGSEPRSLRLPLIGRYVVKTARKKNWSAGQVISEMRGSGEVSLFRAGLKDLQEAVDADDAKALDSIFEELDAAASAWSRRLGSRYSRRQVSVTVSLPFVSVGKELSVGRLRRRRAGGKLLVFVDQLLGQA